MPFALLKKTCFSRGTQVRYCRIHDMSKAIRRQAKLLKLPRYCRCFEPETRKSRIKRNLSNALHAVLRNLGNGYGIRSVARPHYHSGRDSIMEASGFAPAARMHGRDAT